MFRWMLNAASRLAAVGRAVEVGAFDFTADGVASLPLDGVMPPTRRTEFPLEWRLPAYTGRAVDAHPLATPSISAFYAIPDPFHSREALPRARADAFSSLFTTPWCGLGARDAGPVVPGPLLHLRDAVAGLALLEPHVHQRVNHEVVRSPFGLGLSSVTCGRWA